MQFVSLQCSVDMYAVIVLAQLYALNKWPLF